VVVLMVVGVILDGLVTLLARWLLRWKGDTRLA
jgi:ABC-type nitrate/sulfonate/bicarbonate transport system permease component